MVDIYTFEIHSLEFDRILSGKKTAQLMLNEAKRKNYTIGNQITFKRNLDTLSDEQKELLEKGELQVELKATISNLLYFGDFIEAINTLGKENCGFRPSVTIEKSSDLFLADGSYEDVEKYGIVAVIFELVQE